MDFFFNCPACHQDMVIDRAGVGLLVKCPKCGRDIWVPNLDELPPSPVPAPDTVSELDKEQTAFLNWSPPPASARKDPER
jgi:Zn-finger nucleic acid-binding protein